MHSPHVSALQKGRIVGQGSQLSEQYGVPVGAHVGVRIPNVGVSVPRCVALVGARVEVGPGVPVIEVRVGLALTSGVGGLRVRVGNGVLLPEPEPPPPPQAAQVSATETARPITAASSIFRIIFTRFAPLLRVPARRHFEPVLRRHLATQRSRKRSPTVSGLASRFQLRLQEEVTLRR